MTKKMNLNRKSVQKLMGEKPAPPVSTEQCQFKVDLDPSLHDYLMRQSNPNDFVNQAILKAREAQVPRQPAQTFNLAHADSVTAHRIRDKFSPLVFRLRAKELGGERRISVGTAFHVGCGFFITAKHVVESLSSGEAELVDFTNQHYLDLQGADSMPAIEISRYALVPTLDLAVIETTLSPVAYLAALNGSQDSDVTAEETALPVAILKDLRLDPDNEIFRPCYYLGFPEAKDQPPELVSENAHVVGLIKPNDDLAMLLDTRPKPGFSGSPVISEDGVVIGVICYANPSLWYAPSGPVLTALSPERARGLAVNLGASPIANEAWRKFNAAVAASTPSSTQQ